MLSLLVLFLVPCIYAAPPNVFMFLIDDMGYNDIPWNNKDIEMPFTASLATDGKILTNAYASHVCSPSRGAFLTGLYPHRIAMSHGVYGESNPECTPQEFKLLPEKLKEAGYVSHAIGKWHLGFCEVDCTATARGFESFYGFYHGAVDHWTRVTSAGTPGFDWHDEKVGDLDSIYEPDWSGADLPSDNVYTQDLLTQRAIKIIDEHDHNKPLFMYLPSPLVHTPMQVAQHYIDDVPESKGDETRRIFIAMCKALDDSIKLTVEAIKAAGLYENSVIIFHSDNGGEMNYGSNMPYRGCKGSLWEGGMHVPAMIHSPLMDESERGKLEDGMTYIADMHSTILDLAGLDTSGLNGEVQTDLIFHGGKTNRDEFIPCLDILFPQLFGQAAIRVGDFKLINGWPGFYDGWESNGTLGMTNEVDTLGLNAHNGGHHKRYDMDTGAMFGYLEQMRGVFQLYNIKEDPLEEHNVIDDYPEIAEELQERLFAEAAVAWKIGEESLTPVEEGLPHHNDGAWVTGFCENGPLN